MVAAIARTSSKVTPLFRIVKRGTKNKTLQSLSTLSPVGSHVQCTSTRHLQYQSSANISSTSILLHQSKAQTAKVEENHEPPLPIRIALVSTVTTLATPSFPALGFLYATLRLTVPDANLRKVMEGRWGSLLSFTTWTILPTLYHGSVASLILPCALSNALVAGGMYGLIDVACHGPSGPMKQVYNSPLLGSGIGATVGYLAPNYVYGPAMEMYGFEGMTNSISYVMNAPLVTEVSVVTGAIAGTVLYPMLYYPIHGVQGMHWGYFSGMALGVSTLGLYYIYYGRENVGLPVPDGSYISPKQLELVDSILRYDSSSGEVEAYSLQSGRFIGSQEQYFEGQELARAARLYGKNGNVVFDDRLLAFIYNYWDVNTKSRHADHVVEIKTDDDLEQRQGSFANTDAAVAIMLRTKDKSRSAQLAGQSDVVSILDKIDSIRKDSKSTWLRKQPTKADLEDVCTAIELLMALRSESSSESTPKSTLIAETEQFIRKTSPNIVLLASEETYSGASIESQLKAAGWKEPPLDVALSRWEHLSMEKTRQMQTITGASVIVCGIMAAIVSAFVGRS